MDEYRIRITRQAREHLREIRNYIEHVLFSPIAAKNTITAIKAEIHSLKNLPKRTHLTPEQPWHDLQVHRVRVNNYYIYYWIDEEQRIVQITGVINVKRAKSRQLEALEAD